MRRLWVQTAAMRRVLLSLAMILTCSCAWTADTVLLLDGTEHTGTVQWRDAATIGVGSTAINLADVDRLQLAGAAPAPAPLGLWLIDGSRLPYVELVPGDDDAVVARTSLGDLALPLSAVRGWGATLPATAPAAGTADRLVVVSGTYDGRVRGIRAGQLVFVSEALGELTVDLADCLGLRLAGSDRSLEAVRLMAELDPAQPAVALLPGPQPRLAAAPSVQLPQWPTGIPLRVEGGRRIYLSDLTPILVEEEGAFGRVWPHRRDRNLEGGPILLDDVRYAKGVVIHSQARLRWKLHQRYGRFTTMIGIADEVGFEGHCPVIISGDGRELWRRDALTGRDAAERIDLDVTGIDILEIRVEFGERYDIGDRVTLAGAALIVR